ncbi:hypothetical protein PPERSA_05400 [Pseudocohnilembus persalinus]|uniref:Ccc1 family n=1 Tax=Pseudocohnilembus persalinus TaxID=266149 RepID=A0A0V0R7V9_PSEPJ|nr:hypothetical protein PPERSA_05400 [Pseudocohnilembus persalinus]|eukprot:KRX10580.1 hypothetical protein PPERSA_05400 [Pseudocohnilembus persalinus]
MATRDLELARLAFKNKDINMVKKAHAATNPDEDDDSWATCDHKHDENHSRSGDYIKSAVYGGLDGMITTFSVVMASEGAGLLPIIVLTMGVANLIGDGISMALGDYLSSKSEQDFQKLERQREEWEVENNPNGEKKEMYELYVEKGMDPEDAKQMVNLLAKNKKVWVDVMMVEELGLIPEEESPVKNAIITFFSFCIFGVIPILPYIIGEIGSWENNLFWWSLGLTIVALWTLGILKSRVTQQSWVKSGLETFIMGALAAAASYIIGYIFEQTVSGYDSSA